MDTDTLCIHDRDGSLTKAAGLTLQKNMLQSSKSFPTFETTNPTDQHSSDADRKKLGSKERKSNPHELSSSRPCESSSHDGGKKHPTPTPRKPRMGQSSLGQTQPVLPVVSQTARPVPIPRKNPQTSPESRTYCNQNLPASNLLSSTTEGTSQGHRDEQPVNMRPESQLRRHGVRESVISLRDNPMYGDERTKISNEAQGGNDKSHRESLVDSEPPSPPPRRYLPEEVRNIALCSHAKFFKQACFVDVIDCFQFPKPCLFCTLTDQIFTTQFTYFTLNE